MSKLNFMTVKELKEAISRLPNEMQVIVQKDAEGNGYSPLAGVDADAVYVPNSTYSGDVYSTNWTAADAAMSQSDWDKTKMMDRALILYPTN